MPDQPAQPIEPHGTPPDKRFLAFANPVHPWFFLRDRGWAGRMLGWFSDAALVEARDAPEPWAPLVREAYTKGMVEFAAAGHSSWQAWIHSLQPMAHGMATRDGQQVRRLRDLLATDGPDAATAFARVMLRRMFTAGGAEHARHIAALADRELPGSGAFVLSEWERYLAGEVARHQSRESVVRGRGHQTVLPVEEFPLDCLLITGWVAVWNCAPLGPPATLPGFSWWSSAATADLAGNWMPEACTSELVRYAQLFHGLKRGTALLKECCPRVGKPTEFTLVAQKTGATAILYAPPPAGNPARVLTGVPSLP
jgi:hypothetical protein